MFAASSAAAFANLSAIALPILFACSGVHDMPSFMSVLPRSSIYSFTCWKVVWFGEGVQPKIVSPTADSLSGNSFTDGILFFLLSVSMNVRAIETATSSPRRMDAKHDKTVLAQYIPPVLAKRHVLQPHMAPGYLYKTYLWLSPHRCLPLLLLWFL